MNDAALHPTSEQLVAFDRGLLPAEEWPEIDRHVAGCLSCCQKLEELPEDYMIAVIRNAPPSLQPQPTALAGKPSDNSQPTASGASREPLADLPIELQNHPRYRVLAWLASGGMGNVYRAEHKLMGRVVALKVIQNRLLGKPEWIERFRREIRAAAHLNHPNIVHAYDAEQAGDAQVLAMEYVAGETLEHLVEHEGPLEVAEACGYARQVALGLSHAHERGMVHRDIKPQNIVRTAAGEVKILDFGLARFVSENLSSPALTQSGLTVGTPDYLAPEQALDPRRADVRADIYSLGCTLYYLLTGTPPYPDGTPLQKVLSHQEQAPAPLADRCPHVPVELRRAIEKMMAKEARDRYQTPAEVAAVLARWAGGGSPGTQPVVAPTPPRRYLPIFATAGGLLVCLSLAFATANRDGPTTAATDLAATVLVITRLDGASASTIENSVTNPLERAVSRAAGAARIESRSIRGVSIVRIRFRDDVARQMALATASSLVDHARPDLPAGCSPLVMPVGFDGAKPLGIAVVKGPADAVQLAEFARTELCTRLAAVPGVGPLTVEGGGRHVTVIRPDRVKIQARGITMLPLAQTLKGETGDLLTGSAVIGETEYELRAERKSGQKLREIPLSAHHGNAEYIRDVATVEASLDPERPVVWVNGVKGVIVPIYAMAAEADDIAAAVKNAIAQLRQRLPSGLELEFHSLDRDVDHEVLRLQLRLPSGATLERTESLVAQLEKTVRGPFAKEDIALLLTYLGAGNDWPAAFSDNALDSDATLLLRLNPPASGDVERRASILRDALRKDQRLSQADIVVTTPATAAVDVQIYDAALEDGRKLAEEIRGRMAESPRQTQIVERLDAPGYELKIDLARAADLGITGAEVRAEVALATGGQGSSWQDSTSGAHLTIAAPVMESTTDLLNLPIGGARQSRQIRLGDVAQAQRTVVPVEIDHANLLRITRVRVFAEQGDRAAVAKTVREIIGEFASRPGVRIELAE